MKKKFTMLLALLLCCVGAWAQVLTTVIEVGKEYTLKCKAADHQGFIYDDGTTISGRSEIPSNLVFEISETEDYYYLKSKVSGKYINYDGTNVNASEEKSTIWRVNTYQHSANTVSLSASGYTDKYLNNNTTDVANGVSGLKMNSHSGGPGAGNACSLWSLREAVPEVASGKVYRIVNKANANKAISETSGFMLGTTEGRDDDNSQLWYVEGSNVEGYTFRNLSTANYFNYINEFYTLWGTAVNPVDFYLTKVGDAFAIAFNETAQLSAMAYAHYSNGNIVRWQAHDNQNNVNASLWTFEEVSTADAEAAWNTLYQNWYNEISPKFTDANNLIETAGFGINAVTLTTNNTTCPAAISDNSDGGGVSALLDDDDNTFMHTKYAEKGSVDEPHYIQVDLGENNTAKYITFSYRARHNNQVNNPETIIVQGSVDGSSYANIQTLTNLPDGLIDYESSIVGNGTAYRYFRFVVTATSNDAKNGDYVFFSLAKFRMNTVTVNDNYVSKYPVLRNLENWLSENEYTETRPDGWCKKNGTLKKEEISALIHGATLRTYPFILTTDVNNPVCYHIKSGRSQDWEGNYYWTFIDGKLTTVTANDNYAKDVETYWFFMENPETGMLQFVPFIENNSPMGYVAVNDGADKITNVSTVTGFVGADYELVTTDGDNFSGYPYALKPYGSNTYVSNHGGSGSTYMGFYGGLADGGTRFAVEKATIDPSPKLRDLRSAIAAMPDVPTAIGTEIGLYTSESVEAYTAKIEAALEVYNDATKDASEYQEQIGALSTASAVLAFNKPEMGKFYRLKNESSGNYMNGKNDGVNLLKDGGEVHTTVFYLDENNRLLSFNTGRYLDCSAKNYSDVGTAHDGSFGIAVDGAKANVITYKNNGCWTYGAGEDGGSLDRGQNQPLSTRPGYNWLIEEVTWLPFPVNSTLKYGTLYSPVPLNRTTGYSANRVKAYTGSINGDYLTLTEIKGDIPANTPVIIEMVSEDGYTNGCVFLEILDEVAPVEGTNDLVGHKEAVATTGTPYTLQRNDNGGVVFKQYNGTNLNGFKSYLDLTESQAQAIRIRFADDEDVTVIDNVQSADGHAVIHDLQGRRVAKMEKGIYIVNGKKVVIK